VADAVDFGGRDRAIAHVDNGKEKTSSRVGPASTCSDYAVHVANN
jgi:hypothetical protein